MFPELSTCVSCMSFFFFLIDAQFSYKLKVLVFGSSLSVHFISQTDGFVSDVSQATLPWKVLVVLLSLSCKFYFSIFYQTLDSEI